MPAHNVEAYIGQCLESIAAQTYKNIDVLVVLDGCDDRTEDIVRSFSTTHPWVKWVAQEPLGPSAARNRGAKLAQGEFLWFIDSDDVVVPHAAETMVKCLQKSGSDFVVASYYRFNSLRRWNPASWIMQAHRYNRTGVTLSEQPDILCNAVVWSKVFRTAFWRDAHLNMPEGVLYEDQEVTAEAYAQAKQFDVLSDQVYGWRARESRSSITQQVHTVEDLNDRLRAFRASRSVLRAFGSEALARVRLLQFLNNDFRHSMTDPDAVSDEYWDMLRDGLREFTAGMPTDDWKLVTPRVAGLEWLVLIDRRDAVRDYLYQDGMNADVMRTTWRDDTLIAEVPFWDDEDVCYPVEVLAVSSTDIRVEASLRGAAWAPDHSSLTITGWAYITCLDLADNDARIEVDLVSGSNRQHLEVEQCEIPEANVRSSHQSNDYSKSGFRVVLCPDMLNHGVRSVTWAMEVTVTCGSLRQTARIQKMNRWSSALHAGVGVTDSGIQARVRPPRHFEDVLVEVTQPEFSVCDIEVQSDGLTGTMLGHPLRKATPDQVVIYPEHDAEHPVAVAELGIQGENRWDFYLKLPPRESMVDIRKDLLVRVRTGSGDFAICWPQPFNKIPLAVGETGFALARSTAGNMSVWFLQDLRLRVDDVVFTASSVCLSGGAISAHRRVEACLFNKKTRLAAPVSWEGSQWSAVLPLEADLWGAGERVLPRGEYMLGAASLDSDDGSGVREDCAECLVFAQQIGPRVPIQFESRQCNARFELTPARRGQVVIAPPLQPSEQEKRSLSVGRTQVPTMRTSGLREDTILLRSYFGEVATCNQYGIHQAILRMGLDLRVLWAVQDLSVAIPDGGIPVVIGSHEWYEALGTSKFSVWNVHQPDWYRKNPGQVIVETFHGYPFKLAGVPYWPGAGFSSLRVRSYLERQNEWDYLISPAPYATPLLEYTFPGAYTMLEIGYPRNDLYFDPDRTDIRMRVRSWLGISDSAIAVLYAPTFRDWLSDNETTARTSDVLSPAELAARLTPDYVVLMRGHPMEGRGGDVRERGARVIDVTSYPRVEELCLASDVAVLDYSSLRFDYALTNNPMVFFVPDLDQYMGQERGSLIPYEGTAPGPWCRTLEELVDVLGSLDRIHQDYQPNRDAFIKDFLPLEDGHAGERLVRHLLG
ncbi:MAG: CDP-glycerol glycerophosphotransferase family protein [Propionibacteriaceae bacterium]|nr:CDP-glycerol glycerophosphotransferase family protein [Propionibacteriaceae bacterium]